MWKFIDIKKEFLVRGAKRKLEFSCGNSVLMQEIKVGDRTCTTLLNMTREHLGLFEFRECRGEKHRKLLMISLSKEGKRVIHRMASKSEDELIELTSKYLSNDQVMPLDGNDLVPFERNTVSCILGDIYRLLPKLKGTRNTKHLELTLYRTIDQGSVTNDDLWILPWMVRYHSEEFKVSKFVGVNKKVMVKINLRTVDGLIHYFRNLEDIRRQLVDYTEWQNAVTESLLNDSHYLDLFKKKEVRWLKDYIGVHWDNNGDHMVMTSWNGPKERVLNKFIAGYLPKIEADDNLRHLRR